MTKRRKAPASKRRVKRISRNPLARLLATGAFRKRVVKSAGSYRRRPRHAGPGDEDV